MAKKKRHCRVAITAVAPIETMIRMIALQTRSGKTCVAEHKTFLALLKQVKRGLKC
jgi:hypothetical protein